MGASHWDLRKVFGPRSAVGEGQSMSDLNDVVQLYTILTAGTTMHVV